MCGITSYFKILLLYHMKTSATLLLVGGFSLTSSDVKVCLIISSVMKTCDSDKLKQCYSAAHGSEPMLHS